MQYIFFASVLLISWIFASTHFTVSLCRCLPEHNCWPSDEEWSTFNASINGNLIRLYPVGSVCHDPTFNRRACEELKELSRDTGWRASQPGINSFYYRLLNIIALAHYILLGALQDWIWEIGSRDNESCFLTTPKKTSCHQGNIPFYSAVVESENHVQVAIRFATRNNIRLVIRNTGHDLGGRSSSPNSLQINTHRLQYTQFYDDFRPSASNQSLGPAVTVGAGVVMGELYARCALKRQIVVGGDCPTVGVAGGYIQGGGVSDFLSHNRGLAVDNVLEFELVTANAS
ncbi:hypothetical protein N7510_005792 [Penicillium lagena]|uniref:uncharacterized protein n=1 Tax=Penicillium lagena TaxID=94218 RepID=UPI0025411CA9|nr:uncharacterized protein N7510_005792 [Penicillium lagena]KAJ5612598.1 hypothetical protein N7510_005792 [Penicillium lagena]